MLVLSLSLQLICWQILHWREAETTAKSLQDGCCKLTYKNLQLRLQAMRVEVLLEGFIAFLVFLN